MKLNCKILAIAIILVSCQNQSKKNYKLLNAETNKMSEKFESIVSQINNSDIYESSKNWEKRGLNQSDKSIVLLLRKSTNEFLLKLTEIHISGETDKSKLKQINRIVDQLPWSSLDTEEKEFLVDVLAPAIQATGYNPWNIF